MASGWSSRGSGGLDELRRSGAVTELLFLYECATSEPTQLRPFADHLHVTVQAVSHIYRQLSRRGLVEVVDGRYRPTVSGVAWLHETLDGLSADTAERLAHLHVIRSTRAIAADRIPEGSLVTLELVDGLLTARPGARGPSRGRARSAATRGGLVEVTDLEGIVPIHPIPVSVRTLSEADLVDPTTPARLARALAASSGIILALGIEVYALLSAAKVEPVERFAVAEVAREASQVGVPATVVVTEHDLPRLLAEFASGIPPSLDVSGLGGLPADAASVPARRRRGGRP